MKPQAAGGKNRPPHNRERIDEMSGGKTEDRKRLEIDYRVEKARLIAARDIGNEHLRATIGRWLEKLGLDEQASVADVNLGQIAVVETAPNCKGRTERIHVFFRPDWMRQGIPAEERVPKLQIDVPALRARVGLEPERTAAVVAGRLVENIEEIEADLRRFDWLSAAKVEDAVRNARRALSDFDRENGNA